MHLDNKMRFKLTWPNQILCADLQFLFPCKKKNIILIHASFYIVPMNIVKLRKTCLFYVSVPKRHKYHEIVLTVLHKQYKLWSNAVLSGFSLFADYLLKRTLGLNMLNQVSHTAKSANACWCNKKVIVCFFASVREIIHWLKLVDYCPV